MDKYTRSVVKKAQTFRINVLYQSEPGFKLSPGLVDPDWGVEIEGSKVWWVGWNLQFCVWVLLDSCSLCEYTYSESIN